MVCGVTSAAFETATTAATPAAAAAVLLLMMINSGGQYMLSSFVRCTLLSHEGKKIAGGLVETAAAYSATGTMRKGWDARFQPLVHQTLLIWKALESHKNKTIAHTEKKKKKHFCHDKWEITRAFLMLEKLSLFQKTCHIVLLFMKRR